MPRILVGFLGALALMGFISAAEASPFASDEAHLFAQGLVLEAAFKCEMVEGKLVCGKTGGSKSRDDVNDDDDDNDNDNDEPKKSKDKVIPKTCGKKVNCEAGFVKLEKPNKYGACCEAREGLPPPKQQEAEKCKFPGEVGTPPNCSCPPGTEFMGYRGCLPKKAPDPIGPSPKKVINECYTFPFTREDPQAYPAPFTEKCRDVYKGKIQCDGTFASGKLKCCCTYTQ